jgi:hypothetical protein
VRGSFRLLGPVLLLVACVVVFCVSVTPAFATVARFGSSGEGAGQINGGRAIAIDNGDPLTASSAGDVYVADGNNNRVDKFSGVGGFMLAWGWGVAANGKAEFQTCGPDATPATGVCKAGTEGTEAGEFAEPAGVAVDDSSGASHGDVYVEDKRNNRIEKFSEDGAFMLAWGWGVRDGKAEPETCGPDAAPPTSACLAGLEEQGAGEFDRPEAGTITVGSTGAVFVGDHTRVERFSEGGVFEGQTTLEGASNEIYGLAVDSTGAIYAVRAEFGSPDGLHKYSKTGGELSTLDPLAGYGSVIALGPANELFVEDTGGRIAEYQASGTEVADFPGPAGPGPTGIAFSDLTGELDVLSEPQVQPVQLPPPGPLIESEEATPGFASTATVKASIDPEGKQTRYHVDYGTEVAHESETAPAETAPITKAGEGFNPETVEVELAGLTPDTTYHFHFVASNEQAPGGNVGTDATFTTLPALEIQSESVTQVSTTSARLETTIDPLGLASTYHFEYLTEAQFAANGDSFSGPDVPISLPESEPSAGSGTSGAAFSLLVEGLTEGTTYHYRVRAHNECEPVANPGRQCVIEGADRTFTTQAGEGPGLIDGREWEMVSPPDKRGAALEAITNEGGIIQAAEGGGALAYIAKAPVDAEPAGNRSFAEQQLLARRAGGGAGASSWTTEDLATPHEAVAGLKGGELSEYRQFSPDLATAMLEPTGATLLSPWASERTPYLRAGDGEYVPLLTGCPAPGEPCAASVEEHADVPAGTKFGSKEEAGQLFQKSGVEFRLATPDLSHALITAPQSLTPPFETGGVEAVYEWSEGRGEPARNHVEPVSVLPGGASASGANGASVGQNDQLMRNAISTNGERAFFESEQHLYFRDVARHESVQLDAPEEGARGGNSEARFQYATPDGSKVFFTDTAGLTTSSAAKEGEADLYMCELGTSVDERSCAAKGDLKDLTTGFGGTPGDVRGAVIAASEDGSYLYFVANGILANAGTRVANAIHGNCSLSERAGSCNLYVSHDGVTSLVAVLSGNDFPDWEAGLGADLSRVTARVSPNGRYLAFSSQRSLTGYDNRDAVSGAPDEEVFVYDAASARTVCASCDPTGARPVGVLEPKAGEETTLLVDRVDAWGSHWVAGSIPGWTPGRTSTALYQSRYLSNVGRLFFDTPDGLVADDTNSTQDVYEFEPEGVGDCATSSAGGSVVYKPARTAEIEGGKVEEGAGCVGLISSGTSAEESVFLDATGTGPGGQEGEEVFFLTAARLSDSDVDNALDVYDARICSAATPCPPTTVSVSSPACTTTDSCRAGGGESNQEPGGVFGAPATATFSGPGNPPPAGGPAPNPVKPKTAAHLRAEKLAKALKACRVKRAKKKRIACDRAAHKRYGPAKKAKKAGNERRAGR